MLKIVDAKETFKGEWKPKLPDFSSHISDEGPFWEEGQDEELTSFEDRVFFGHSVPQSAAWNASMTS